MNTPRLVIAATVGVIVVTTIVSGPLVSGVDLTTAGNATNPLRPDVTDRAVVQVERQPTEPVILRKGAFGNNVYQLHVPPMEVRLREIQGTPRITYTIRIAELRYSRVTSHFVNASNSGGSYQLDVATTTFPANSINKSQYSGTLSVTVHDSSGTSVIYRTNTTVLVEE